MKVKCKVLREKKTHIKQTKSMKLGKIKKRKYVTYVNTVCMCCVLN